MAPPPVVDSTNPIEGSTSHGGGPIEIQFNVPMDQASVEASTSLYGSPPHDILFYWPTSSKVMVVPVTVINPGSTVTLNILNTAKSLAGLYMVDDFILTYHVTPATEVKRGADFYTAQIFIREPAEDYFDYVPYRFLHCSFAERLDDAKNITITLAQARFEKEQVFAHAFHQGQDIIIVGKFGSAILFSARGIVIDNIDSERNAIGLDTIKLELRGLSSVLDNTYSDKSVLHNKPLNACASLLSGYQISDSTVHPNSVKLIGSENDGSRVSKDNLDGSILSRMNTMVENSSSELHYCERDDIMMVTTARLKATTYIKMLLLQNQNYRYIVYDSDFRSMTRKSPRAKVSASFYKYGTRYISKVYDNLLRKIGRRDDNTEDRETSKNMIIKDMLRDEEIELVSSKPFNYPLGSQIDCRLNKLQFRKRGYLVARSYDITPNSFECKLTLNVVPKPLIAELKLALRLE